MRKACELRQVGHRRSTKKPGPDRRPELSPAQGDDDEVQPFRHQAHDQIFEAISGKFTKITSQE
jgi:hypothetical protein